MTTSPPAAGSPAGASPPSRGVVLLLKENREIRLLWLAGLVSQLGSMVSWMVVRDAVTDYSRASLTVLGFLELLGLVSQIASRFVFAPVLDRVDRRRLMVNLNLFLSGLCLLGILALQLRSIWLFALKNTIEVMASAIYAPALAAVIPQLAAREDLTAANMLNRLAGLMALVFGPAISGFLTARLGRMVAFIIDGLGLLTAAFITLGLKGDFMPKAQKGVGGLKGMWADNMVGLRAISHTAVLLITLVLVMTMYVVLGMLNTVTFPLYTQCFHVSAGTIGLGRTIEGLGMALGLVLFGGKNQHYPVSIIRIVMPAVLLVTATANIARTWSPNWLAYALVGAINYVIITPGAALYMTLVQQQAPEQAMGRAMASQQVIQILAMSLGAALTPVVGRYVTNTRQIHFPFGVLMALAGLASLACWRIFGE